MRYALLIYREPGAFERLPSEQRNEIYQRFQAIGNTPGVAGGIRLKDADNATTVRMDDGHVLVSDGPFADTKEILGGVLILDAENIEAALEIAQKIPVLPFGGSVEIRPVHEARLN